MVLALVATVVVVVVLLGEVMAPRVQELWARHRARRRRVPAAGYDPGRERRAEQKARLLLKSCVNDEEWAMYRDLGFIRIWGRQAAHPVRGVDVWADAERGGAPYAYLVYPHKPIVAYLPQTRRLLNEYCVEFPDPDPTLGPDTDLAAGARRLPDSDDVLAKWMALTGDERGLIARANLHLPGRQVDPKQVRRDLWRLSEWERERAREERRSASAGKLGGGPGSASTDGTVPTP